MATTLRTVKQVKMDIIALDYMAPSWAGQVTMSKPTPPVGHQNKYLSSFVSRSTALIWSFGYQNALE